MKNQDFTIDILVDQSPEDAFEAVTNTRGWWSENIKGGTAKLNDEFDYSHNANHHCQIRLVEVIPNEKVVWSVLDNYFSFEQGDNEWTGTKISFEIKKKKPIKQRCVLHIMGWRLHLAVIMFAPMPGHFI